MKADLEPTGGHQRLDSRRQPALDKRLRLRDRISGHRATSRQEGEFPPDLKTER